MLFIYLEIRNNSVKFSSNLMIDNTLINTTLERNRSTDDLQSAEELLTFSPRLVDYVRVSKRGSYDGFLIYKTTLEVKVLVAS